MNKAVSFATHIETSYYFLGRSGSKNDKESEEEDALSVGDGLQWWVVLLITLAIVVCIFILVKCCVELQVKVIMVYIFFSGGWCSSSL